jgi:hypothetical protein
MQKTTTAPTTMCGLTCRIAPDFYLSSEDTQEARITVELVLDRLPGGESVDQVQDEIAEW